jgi:hypothetical protein
MGPVRRVGEETSAFRMRYASYCTKWLVPMSVLLCILIIVRPPINGLGIYVVAPLYLVLGFGTGMSLLAGLSFLVGAWWARRLEQSYSLSKKWQRLIATVAAVIAFIGWAVCVFVVVRGIAVHTVPIPDRFLHYRPVSWGAEPLTFALSISFYSYVALVTPYYVVRGLRRAYAT